MAGNDFPSITTPRFPIAEVTSVAPVIGNPQTYREITRAIRAHGDSQAPLSYKGSFQESRFPITTRLFKGLKLNPDDHSDFLLLRSADIFTLPGQKEEKRGRVSFLLFVPGNEASDKTGAPTEEMIAKGQLLSAAYLIGRGNPIGNLELIDENKDGVNELRFTERRQSRVFDTAKAQPTLDNQHLLNVLFKTQAFFMNNNGYFDVLLAVNDVGNEAQEVQQKSIATFYNQFGFAFAALKNFYQNILRDPVFTAVNEKENPDSLPFARALFTNADHYLALPKKELDKVAELSSHANKLAKEALDRFRWQEGDWSGKKMERAEFYKTLAETADAAKRRDLTGKYSAVVVSAHKQKEGLFPMIDELNAIARKYGYESYPDYNDRVFFGMTPKDFAALTEDFHARYGQTIAAFIDDLQKINGGQPVYEWDVDYLSNRFIKEKTGGALPELSFPEAYKIAKRWFKDIGLDLEKPPFKGKIFFDMKKRENKYGNAFATAFEDGSRAWFNTNFDPAKKISLEDLNTVIHELTHDVQYILGSAKAGGNVITGAGGLPTTWIEGSAMTMGDIVFNKDWIDKYLSHLPEFKDPAVRTVAADVLGKQHLYQNMMVLCRALLENNLYEDRETNGAPRPLEARLHFWETIARKYMHVGTMPATEGGYIYATPHFAHMPAYYVSYGGGRTLGVQAMEVMFEGLAQRNGRRLLEGGRIFASVLKQGSRVIDAKELGNAIQKAKQSSQTSAGQK